MNFDPDSWDGSDISIPPGTGFMMMVGRAKRAIEKAQLTNAVFHPATETENQTRNLMEWMKARGEQIFSRPRPTHY